MHSIKEFDYVIPKQLIAQEPAKERHESKLLIYHKKGSKIQHKRFRDIINYLNPGDIIVVNETKVMKTRLYGCKRTGGRAAITVVNKIDDMRHDVFVSCKNPKIGTELIFEGGLKGKIIGFTGQQNERFIIEFNKPIHEILESKGDYTLPGYIHNSDYERQRYQTVFAREEKEGSIAAPTAGLHFSKELVRDVENKGVRIAKICLHVGIGTFNEVREDDYTKHRMHKEWVEVTEKTANLINERNKRGGRLFVVGTTTLRALETAAVEGGTVHPFIGPTDLFIRPGYRFKLRFDGMITNFHLPRSTLLLLVATIIGDAWRQVYVEAIRKRYRFYSFGDAMLILK